MDSVSRSLSKRASLRVDFDSVEIDERQTVVIFAPGNSNDQGLFCGDEFCVARWRVPFAHDLRAESLGVEESPKCRHCVLVHAVPVFTEVVAFEESFQPADPFGLHRGAYSNPRLWTLQRQLAP